MTKKCVNCGFENGDDKNKCTICGNDLAASVNSFYDPDNDYYSEPRTIYDNDNGNNPYDGEFIENVGNQREDYVDAEKYIGGGIEEHSQYKIPRSTEYNTYVTEDETSEVVDDTQTTRDDTPVIVEEERSGADDIINDYRYRKTHNVQTQQDFSEQQYRQYDTQQEQNTNTQYTNTGYTNPEYNNSQYNNENTYNNNRYQPVKREKSKFITLICSFFFFGGGYVYIGEYISFIVALIVAVILTTISGGLLAIILWGYYMYDSILKVDLYNNGEDTSDLLYGVKHIMGKV